VNFSMCLLLRKCVNGLSSLLAWTKVVTPSQIDHSVDLDIDFILIDERKGGYCYSTLASAYFGLLDVRVYAAKNGWLDFEECFQRLRTTNFGYQGHLIKGIRGRIAYQ
jgi:hypothetical protein